MKNSFKINHFSSRERVGLLALFVIIALLSGLYWGYNTLIDHEIDNTFNEDSTVVRLQQSMDSLKNKLNDKSYKIYPFNPNYLTEYKAYRLGLSAEEFSRLQKFRAQDQWINSTRDFKTVTKISDSLLAVISPYFKFPDWVVRQQQNKSQSKNLKTDNSSKNIESSQPIVVKDLNTATKEELMEVRGIGDKLSDRIIKYRTVLKGFTYDDQLYEVWYLDKTVADEVLKHFKVMSKPQIEKVNINTATFKEVMHSSPYIDYNLTKQIFDYKNAAGKVISMDVLKKLDSFPLDKFERINLYLTAE